MKFLVILGLLGTLALADTLCPAYQCISGISNAFRSAPEDFHYCAHYRDAIKVNEDNSEDGYKFYSVMSCPNMNGKHATCSFGSLTANTHVALCYQQTTTPTTAYLYPGQACTKSSECLGIGQCTDDVCQGRKVDEACETSDDCIVGNYCSNKKCAQLIEVGQACTVDGSCVPYASCNKNVCTQYLSVENGSDAESANLCKSYTVENGKCVEGLKSQQSGRVGAKTENGVCKYSRSTGAGPAKNSVCGMGQQPSAYCPLGTADDAFTRVLDSVKTLVDKKITTCHVNDFPCKEIKNENLQGYTAFGMLNTFADTFVNLQDNADCDMWNNNYDSFVAYQGSYPAVPNDLSNNGNTASFNVDTETIFGRVATE